MNARLIPALLALSLIAGCETTTEAENLGGEVQSITDAGITTLVREPVLAPVDQHSVGDRTVLTFGKEYGTFSATVKLSPEDGEPISIQVNASEVAAFAGQQIGAMAAVEIQAYLTQQNIEISKAQADALEGIIANVMRAAFPAPTLSIPATE